MFYIVGLGNPGEKYKSTRHNIGWSVLDYLQSENNLPQAISSKSVSGLISEAYFAGQEITLLYPETYMNNSGTAVAKLVPKNEIGNLIVVHDDIDLPFGELKIVTGRGAGGNNGVKSIIDKLNSNDFIRLRVGIAPKSLWTGKVKRPSGGGPLERFVLKPFSLLERRELSDILDRSNQAIRLIIEQGVEVAMNQINKSQ